MTTLFQATLDLARLLGATTENSASAQGAVGKTTLIDTSIPRNTPSDDFFNKGCLWFIDCTNATLEGTTAVITDWTNSSCTFTFAAAAAQTNTGDVYAATTREWPRDVLRRAINLAAREIGIPDQEDVTLTTVAEQQEYDLPAGVFNVKKFEYATDTAAPYDYVELDRSHWYEIAGHLKLRPGYEFDDGGYKIRLTYNVVGGELDADTETIPDLIHPDLLAACAAVHAVRWQLNYDSTNDHLKTLMVDLMAQKEVMMRRHGQHTGQAPHSWEGSVFAYPNTLTGLADYPGDRRPR